MLGALFSHKKGKYPTFENYSNRQVGGPRGVDADRWLLKPTHCHASLGNSKFGYTTKFIIFFFIYFYNDYWIGGLWLIYNKNNVSVGPM